MTNIYITNIEENKISLNELIKKIPQNILKYVTKYKEENSKYLSATSWYILVKYLKDDFNIDIEKEKVYENNNHKPLMDNIYFNISHSSCMCCVIISNKNCGIDIEEINERIKHQAISKRFFSDSMYQEYLISDNKLEKFIMEWTKKEAYFKYIGTGIKLNELSIDLTINIESRLIKKNNNYYYVSYITEEKVNNIKRIVLP